MFVIFEQQQDFAPVQSNSQSSLVAFISVLRSYNEMPLPLLTLLFFCFAIAPMPVQSENPGHCPKPSPDTVTICIYKCDSDADCTAGEKCCSYGCARDCYTAVKPHLKACPAELQLEPNCEYYCDKKQDCGQHEICCYNGCGFECVATK
ncbi:WAP four-disulfide core domain protein 3-like [Penaeus chinensis]|uniref:WAP four-disulfide core domain protein 3-like n=1 Tax=Penaeus chinensis TaxID=139456 RepID=UPI001FB6F476|nr:WAP four-disulfide core domain protein 3-like [Penaeus chinensis]